MSRPGPYHNHHDHAHTTHTHTPKKCAILAIAIHQRANATNERKTESKAKVMTNPFNNTLFMCHISFRFISICFSHSYVGVYRYQLLHLNKLCTTLRALKFTIVFVKRFSVAANYYITHSRESRRCANSLIVFREKNSAFHRCDCLCVVANEQFAQVWVRSKLKMIRLLLPFSSV